MITLKDYLDRRFSKGCALTRKEASIIGIKYPPKSGWPKIYANLQIDDEMLSLLDAIAGAKQSKNQHELLVSKERKRLRSLRKAGAISDADEKQMLIDFEKSIHGHVKVKAKSLPPVKDGFYASKEWREVRYKALVSCGAQCQCCGSTRKDGAKLHVDHIKPRSKFPSLQLDISNLQVLCEDCNLGKSNKDDTDWR